MSYTRGHLVEQPVHRALLISLKPPGRRQLSGHDPMSDFLDVPQGVVGTCQVPGNLDEEDAKVADLYLVLGTTQSRSSRDGAGRDTDTRVIETADRDRSAAAHFHTTLPMG